MSEKLVSVVIPTYNRGDDVVEAIRSVRRQTHSSREIIVVDDDSDDATVERVRNVKEDDITLLRHRRNRGASASRNTGAHEASGDWIAFLDSDDRWEPERLERQLDAAREASETPALVYSGVTVVEENGVQILPDHRGDIYRRQLERDRTGPTSTWLVRAECFEELGGFDESYPVRNDYEFSIRLTERYPVEYVREPLVRMRTSDRDRLTADVQRRIDVTERLIEEVVRPRAVSFDDADRRKILASQYFVLGRYCQKQERYEQAREYLLESLRDSPVQPRAGVTYLLALLGTDLPGVYYGMRDRLRGLRSTLGL